MAKLQQRARGERPRYFEDPAVDKVLAITLALAGEVAVLRERIDSIERLSAAGVTPSPQAVDAYRPNAEVRAAREQWRDGFLEQVLRIVHQEREAMERRLAEQPYDQAVELVEEREPTQL